MGEKILLKSFEQFKGLDYRRSPLTAEHVESTDLKNTKFTQGLSLMSRYGYQMTGQEGGFVSAGVFSYFDKDTGATQEMAIAINDFLWFLSSGSFSVSRSGGVSWTWRWYPTSTGTTITLELIEGGAVAHTTTFSNTSSVRDVFEYIDGLANYSCTYTGEYAKVNGAQTATTITVDAGHTYAFGDIVTIYDTFASYGGTTKNMLTARRVESVAATTITISSGVDYSATASGQVTVTDNLVLGPMGAKAAGIPYTGAGAESSNDKDITFFYWAPAIWNSANGKEAPFKSFHSYSRLGYPIWRHASFVSAGNRLFIGTYTGAEKIPPPIPILPYNAWDGYPHCFDGREVYRAGLPKAAAPSTINATGGGNVTAGRYRWKIVYKYYSKNGDITYGQPSEYAEYTSTVSYYFTLTSVTPPFNTAAEIVTSIAATASNTLTLSVYGLGWLTNQDVNKDWSVRILNRQQPAGYPSTGVYENRKIVSYDGVNTTITISGAPLNVSVVNAVYANTFEGGPFRGGFTPSIISGTTLGLRAEHTIYPNDDVYFDTKQNSTTFAGVHSLEKRTVSSVTAHTVTLDGPNLFALPANGMSLSCGIVAEIYRTKAGGIVYYKVGEVACPDRLDGFNFVDNCADADLGEQLIEPEIGKERDPPPAASIVVGHQGGLVYTGIPTDPNTIAWNDLGEGLEAVPLASNYTDISSNQVGPISAAASYSDDALMIFKPAACYALSGDLNAGAFVSRPLNEGDYGISSHASVQKLSGVVVGIGALGVNLFGGEGAVKEFAQDINTRIRNNKNLLLEQAIAANDYTNRMYRIFIPEKWESGFGTFTTINSIAQNALEYSYDYERGAWFNASHTWLVNDLSKLPSGGMFMYENRFHHMSRQGYGQSGGYGGLAAETSSPPTGTSSPSWLYCDGLALQSNHFTTDWVHLGEPSVKKLFLRLKLFRFISSEEQNEVSSPLSLRVRFYRDWNETTAFQTNTLTFSGYTDVEKLIKLTNLSAKAIKFAIDTDSATSLQTFFLSGWELVVGSPYQPTDLLMKQNA